MSDNVDENKQQDKSAKYVRGGKYTLAYSHTQFQYYQPYAYPAFDPTYAQPPAYFNYEYQYTAQPATFPEKPAVPVIAEERKLSDAVLKIKEHLIQKGVKVNEEQKAPPPPTNADKVPPPRAPFVPPAVPIAASVAYLPRQATPPIPTPPPLVPSNLPVPTKTLEALPPLKIDAKPFIPNSIKSEKNEVKESTKPKIEIPATATETTNIVKPAEPKKEQTKPVEKQQPQPQQKPTVRITTTTTTTSSVKKTEEVKPNVNKPITIIDPPTTTATTSGEKEKEGGGGEEDDEITETDEKKIAEVESKIVELHETYGIYIYPAEILEFFRDSLDEDDIKKGKDNVANYKVFIKDRNNLKYIPLQGSFMKSKQSNVVLKRAKDRFNVKRRKDEDESFFGSIRVSLNKLSEDNYDVVSDDILKQEFKSYSQCQKLVELLFEKAVMEKSFCKIYAKLCAKLNSESNNLIKKLIHTEFLNGVYTILVDGSDKKEEFIPTSQDEKGRDEEVYEKAYDSFSFRRIILGICQNEFSKEVRFDELEKRRTELNASRPSENSKEYLDWYREYDDLEIEQTRMKTRMLGTVHFIGELYLQKKAKGDRRTLITKQIISKSCFPTLLKNPDDDDKIEALCKLLLTIGSKFVREDEASLNEVINKLKELQSNTNLSTRVRISVIPDLLDVTSKGWGNPTTPITPTTTTPSSTRNNNNNNNSNPSPRSTRHGNNSNGGGKNSQDVRGNTPHRVYGKSSHNNKDDIPSHVSPVPTTPTTTTANTATVTTPKEDDEEEVVELTKKDKDLIVGFWTSYVDEEGKDSSIIEGFDDLKKTKGKIYDILIIGYSIACNKYSSSKNEKQLLLFLNLMDLITKGTHPKHPEEYKITNDNNKPVVDSLNDFIKKDIEGLIDDIPKATEIMGRIISIYIQNKLFSLKDLYVLLKSCNDNDNKSFTIEILCHTISILEAKNIITKDQIEKEIESLHTDLIELTNDNLYPIPTQLHKIFSSSNAGKYFPQYSEALHLLKLVEKNEMNEAKKLVESIKNYLDKYEFIGLYLYGLIHSKVEDRLSDGIKILVEVSKQVKTPVIIQYYILKGITSCYSIGVQKIKYDDIIILLKSNGLLSKEAIETFKKDSNFFSKKNLHIRTLDGRTKIKNSPTYSIIKIIRTLVPIVSVPISNVLFSTGGLSLMDKLCNAAGKPR